MANEATAGAGGATNIRTSRSGEREERTAELKKETDAVKRDAQSMSDQIEELRSDLAAVAATLSDLVRSGAREGRETVERTADYYLSEGRRQADAALDGARAYGEALEGQITRNPFSAVLVALGLGFLVGLMSRR
jgi:ElaB/YqjD/DUF883 family membrane-anchored ribosome-binding protein